PPTRGPLMNPKTSSRSRDIEWASRLAIFVSGLLLFETVSGLSIWLLPFSIPNQLLVLLHTVVGLVFLVPFLVYQAKHWVRYKNRAWSHYMVTGYVAFFTVALNAASGVILTWQGLFGRRISYGWDTVHIVTTLAILAFLIPHVVLLLLRDRKAKSAASQPLLRAERKWTSGVVIWTIAGFVLLAVGSVVTKPTEWNNEFPEDYSWVEDSSPFAPSLATTASGGAFDDRSLTGSEGCGTVGCHEQIYEEWAVSAHRWASMDPAFQAIQEVMAKQNGAESTRYCGGCHDPASLFAGTKNVFTDNLSSLRGYQEGVSCIVCHSIQDTDLAGNANYTMRQPTRYLGEIRDGAAAKFVSDFLIRTYPDQHMKEFSKTLFKTPEYCAACHKQFIDEQVNQVGWVQLQNQYDNWRKSKWNPADDPANVVECRECHMPLIAASTDPASGDTGDLYRTADDGKHRDHRFIGSNSFVPALLGLEGAEEHARLTEAWLSGEREIPEIAHKWASGPAVELSIQAPDVVRAGAPIDMRVVITSNKVGHDFPTGPLDIIQSWIAVEVTDDNGNTVYSSGAVDEKNFIAPGTFMFKAEPVDRYGNLIDRHNLWEMVGVRFRRAVFPGFSDAASYTFTCPSEVVAQADAERPSSAEGVTVSRDFHVEPGATGNLHVAAYLDYRKIDQYLINFVFGEDSGLTTPVIRMSTAEKTIRVEGT
ncbi:cytochrome c family protein, partial [bacterium]|nr:cytochrome c family protein [bacterium]